MESLEQSSSGFRYRLNSAPPESHHGFSTVLLQVFVHNARNIHNICIYDNQDVYAKFSLTYNPDYTISTRVVHRAGKNPEFNEKLMISVTQIDAVLKCEIWMMSRARHYMEDQLLGFVLVPVSDIIGKDTVTHEYSLSSTDLLHSPAGTIKLTLSVINPSVVSISSLSNPKIINTSISSEVVLLDPQVSEAESDDPAAEYTRIEFPDMNVASENRQMVTEYFNGLNLRPNMNPVAEFASFLCLGSSHQPETDKDSDTTMVCSEENAVGIMFSPNLSFQNSEFMASSSTTTSLSDDRNTADSNEKQNHHLVVCQSSSKCPETPTSNAEARTDQEETKIKREANKPGLGQLLGDMNLEAEQTAMQKQIVDMYMRSMQQFSESLAKMKLPMDLHHKPSLQRDEDQNTNGNNSNSNAPMQIQNRANGLEIEKKQDRSRVFYGSRAFF
ncbi:PREDICTED: uncharacterized protein LOC104799124 [Tarenaya hassleriana]|uniref:uncharacterized protein LOC104799124 n=1 Tax=Tarenaya hassleriana TaxID=28532 RepID=UPI00053C5F05|nr:PREDICTED: uncharacterized protein LOC104799124 [Tarenaya hassleriana]XP_010519789.1 PREDICTED: uncharacterized protein LOC104799124 [Tarenaya hassleriana]XP_010519790.1 PREDICTED: uncharacterized protein LOC104799124 [Tarenaya hassleriana]XP_010519792.1 PREDICTED: uncharacterized protein LOC104799124 [Tarenaya hassleriana]XP_010519794.1 PREDICTED: uncharacterized protein LOC104799124 [Tarenaya hassleriana]XP_010519795.1 PREDICTED: uncharacterized protein LOC104799124 [Tarenaya hassleriana]